MIFEVKSYMNEKSFEIRENISVDGSKLPDKLPRFIGTVLLRMASKNQSQPPTLKPFDFPIPEPDLQTAFDNFEFHADKLLLKIRREQEELMNKANGNKLMLPPSAQNKKPLILP